MINMVNKSSNPLPSYAKDGDAGMDIASNEDINIRAFSWVTIGTGLYVAIPYGHEGQVRSRSGLAAKFGLQVLNTPGTIDSGYRGEIKVIIINHNHWAYEVNKGDRIAQLVIAPIIMAKIVEVAELSDSDRGEGGFGSTGK